MKMRDYIKPDCKKYQVQKTLSQYYIDEVKPQYGECKYCQSCWVCYADDDYQTILDFLIPGLIWVIFFTIVFLLVYILIKI